MLLGSRKKMLVRAVVIFSILFAGVNVQPVSAFVLSDYTLFARDTIKIKDRSVITDGYIGANRYAELGMGRRPERKSPLPEQCLDA